MPPIKKSSTQQTNKLHRREAGRFLGLARARGGYLGTYPQKVLNGPFVVLTNEFAGSDGDILPHMVQRAGLAPVIGVRSWGGVVGIRSDKPLVDGGMVTQPEFANFYPGEGWALVAGRVAGTTTSRLVCPAMCYGYGREAVYLV